MSKAIIYAQLKYVLAPTLWVLVIFSNSYETIPASFGLRLLAAVCFEHSRRLYYKQVKVWGHGRHVCVSILFPSSGYFSQYDIFLICDWMCIYRQTPHIKPSKRYQIDISVQYRSVMQTLSPRPRVPRPSETFDRRAGLLSGLNSGKLSLCRAR